MCVVVSVSSCMCVLCLLVFMYVGSCLLRAFLRSVFLSFVISFVRPSVSSFVIYLFILGYTYVCVSLFP